MVYIVGVTGGIASGKSSAAKLLAAKCEAEGEVNLVDADKLGHLAYAKGSPAYHSLIARFGAEKILAEADEGAKGEEGDLREIDRRKLGGIVFSDKAEMDALCQIVWPVIRSSIESTIQETSYKEKQSSGAKKHYLILEAAVMLEAGWEDLVTDMMLVTYVDRDLAKTRLMERNSLSEEEALKRINAQMTNSERLTRVCDNGTTSEVSFEENNVTFYEGQPPVGVRLTVTLENKGSEDDLKAGVAIVVGRILGRKE